MADWTAKVIQKSELAITRDGTAIDTIDAGELGTLTFGGSDGAGTIDFYEYVRNGMGQAQVKLHPLHPDVAAWLPSYALADRELWLYDPGGTLRFMGAVAAASGELTDSEQGYVLRLKEAGPYDLNGKVFGPADRVSHMSNGGFETGDTTDWTEVGGATFTVQNTNVIEGDWSLTITDTGNTSYIEQTFSVTVSYDLGLKDIIGVRANLDTAPGRGIKLLEVVTDVPDSSPGYYYTSGDEQPGDELFIQAAPSDLPVGTWNVTVRGCSINGSVTYDSFRDALPDSTGALAGDDLGLVFERVLEYSQTPTSPVNQSAGIFDHDIGTLGYTLVAPKGFAWENHENVWSEGIVGTCDEFGCDAWFDLDRNLRADLHRGITRTALAVDVAYASGAMTVTIGDPAKATFVGCGVDLDPAQVFTSIIVVGDGLLFAKDEAGAVDATELGGTIRTKVLRAANSSTFRSMGSLAEQTLEKVKHIEPLPTVVYQIPDLDDAPDPGDLVALTVDFGAIQNDDTYRIESVRVVPKTNEVTVTLDVDWAA